MSFELIQGERGSYVGEKVFFTTLMRILKKEKILLIILII